MTVVGDRRPAPAQPGGPSGDVPPNPAQKTNGGSGPSARGWWGPRLTFLCGGAVGVMLSARVAGGGALLASRWWLLAEITAWAAAWLAAVVAAFHLPRRAAVALILVVAVALRVAALAGPPTTSDDLFRYSWDGRVQAAGVNPYRYPPGSTELTGLRERWLWPAERPCPLAYRPLHCTRINRSWAPTIYPPVAEAWFGAVYSLTGIGARHKPWQVAGLLTDIAVVALLATALRRRGRDPRWVALYALCPAPVLEVVNNGHIDGLAILLSLAALVVASRPRAGGEAEKEQGATRVVTRELAAGALIGLATLVKLYPALLILALAAASPDRRVRSLIRIGGAAAVVAVAGYLPHFLRVGTKVVGFLPDYFREEHYDGAGRYLVAGALRVPGDLAGAVSVGALVVAAVWVWTRRPPAPAGAALLMGTLLLATSPVQPWYAVTLLAVAALAVEPAWAALVAAGYPYFFAVILLHPNRVGVGQLAYGLAALAVSAPLLRRRVRTGRPARRRRQAWRKLPR